MGGEHREELELLRSQVDGPAVEAKLVGHEVKLEAVADLERDTGPAPRPFLEQRGPAGQLGRPDRLGKGLVVALAKRLDPGCRGVRRAEMDRAQGRALAALGGDELDIALAGRRHGHDRDPRPIVLEQAREHSGIRDCPDPGRGRGDGFQFERRAIGGQHEPRRVPPFTSTSGLPVIPGRWNAPDNRVLDGR